MRNLAMFGAVLLILSVSLLIGVSRYKVAVKGEDWKTKEWMAEHGRSAYAAPPREEAPAQPSAQTPVQTPERTRQNTRQDKRQETRQETPQPAAALPEHYIQVLNGSNINRAAKRMTDLLRERNPGFDIDEKIYSLPLRNYPSTMIISRDKDMRIANEIEKHLKTGKVLLVRNNEQHTVTVIVGHDFQDIEKRLK
ncbi:MAG: LytR C-terminal domain-containing protein [Chitinispirillia bacterium]|nr:LytR C-terminal domain-containing protein [Chitinispirillia bacterium]MCL2269078.1 LytR C-terminal domain-containing protein [Chitinispirillia bacterium]